MWRGLHFVLGIPYYFGLLNIMLMPVRLLFAIATHYTSADLINEKSASTILSGSAIPIWFFIVSVTFALWVARSLISRNFPPVVEPQPTKEQVEAFIAEETLQELRTPSS